LSKETLTEQELFDQYTHAKASGNVEKLSSLLSDKVEVVANDVASQPEPQVLEQGVVEQAEGTEVPEATKDKVEQAVLDDPFNGNVNQEPTNKEPAPANSKDADKASPVETVETLRAELAKVTQERDTFKHQFNSNAGRITAFQKTIADLRSRLALLEQTQPRKAADKPSVKTDIRKNPKFVQLAEADPALADIIGELLDETGKGIREEYETGLQNTTQAVADVERERYIQGQFEIVKQTVPNVEEVVQSEEYKYFFNNVATPRMKALLESEHAIDGLEGLRIYASWLDSVSPQNAPAAKTPEAPPTQSDEARKLAEARDRRLKAKDVSSSQVTPQGNGGGSGEEDLEALFAQTTKAALQRVMPLRR
jgi:hypothetical protein